MTSMTVKDILDSVHIAYEQATDTPSISEDDGAIRLNLLQKGVRRWGKDNTTRWDELFTVATIGPIIAGQQEYNIDDPDDPDAPGLNLPEAVFLQGSSRPMEVHAPQQITGVDGHFVTFLGNGRTGHKLRLGWTPSDTDQETGKTLTVLFYREPFVPTGLTDRVEMSDPEYLVAYITGELFVNDDTNMYAKFNGDALNSLDNMRQRNGQVALGQSNGIESQSGDDNMGIGGI